MHESICCTVFNAFISVLQIFAIEVIKIIKYNWTLIIITLSCDFAVGEKGSLCMWYKTTYFHISLWSK